MIVIVTSRALSRLIERISDKAIATVYAISVYAISNTKGIASTIESKQVSERALLVDDLLGKTFFNFIFLASAHAQLSR